MQAVPATAHSEPSVQDSPQLAPASLIEEAFGDVSLRCARFAEAAVPALNQSHVVSEDLSCSTNLHTPEDHWHVNSTTQDQCPANSATDLEEQIFSQLPFPGAPHVGRWGECPTLSSAASEITFFDNADLRFLLQDPIDSLESFLVSLNREAAFKVMMRST